MTRAISGARSAHGSAVEPGRLASRLAKLLLLTLTAACGGAPPDGSPPEASASEIPAEPPPPAPLSLDLADAAAQGLVAYEVAGMGASSGGALTLRIRRLVPAELTLLVAAGTIFLSGSAGVQNMVAGGKLALMREDDPDDIEEVEHILLADDLTRTYLLEAYCLDFHLENPAPVDAFQIAAVEPRAAMLLGAARSAGLSVAATQSALWIDRDHVTKEEIQAKFEATDQDLEDAWTVLASMPPP